MINKAWRSATSAMSSCRVLNSPSILPNQAAWRDRRGARGRYTLDLPNKPTLDDFRWTSQRFKVELGGQLGRKGNRLSVGWRSPAGNARQRSKTIACAWLLLIVTACPVLKGPFCGSAVPEK